MLVLSRKTEEKIHIGNEIVITVLEVKGNRVRLGIQAPASCPIVRGELLTLADPVEVPALS
jgi:carbon storage regulator